jgi:hypothetical protein
LHSPPNHDSENYIMRLSLVPESWPTLH